MNKSHLLLIGGVTALALLLWVNRGCDTCKAGYTAITNQTGAWPGAGPGVATS